MAKKEVQKEREHALLSASSSHKWLHCPPSARLEDALEDTAGEAAKEGTLAHSMCELKLSKLFTDKNMTTRTFKGRMKKLQEDKRYDPEMERFTDSYVDYVKELAFGFPSAPMIAVEKRLDYGQYAKEGFGTGDCVMLHGNELHVIDFKYGKGVPVSAEANPQLGLYALGALAEYGCIYPIKQIYLHIVQPRLNNISKWEVTLDQLLSWGEWVKGKAEFAYKGEGDFQQGKWCDSCFCKISGTCRCRANENMKLLEDAIDPISGKPREPATLSNDEVGQVLKKAQFLAAWVKKLEKHALDTLIAGGSIPGFKLIEGRSNRAYSNVDALMQALVAAGVDRSLLYEEKAAPVTELEKIIDKDTWDNIVSPFIIKPQGKPTMAPADDKRPEYKVKPSAEDAFGGDNQYKEDK